METYAITIARGFGTGGREIASKLADELGIHSYENRILTLAAQYSGMDEFEFQEVDEKLRKLCAQPDPADAETFSSSGPYGGICLR